MAQRKEARILFITGMHRSNTSLVAKAFHQAGLFMGEQLMPSSPFNQDGYFEEVPLIALHDQFLDERGFNFWDITDAEPFLSGFDEQEEQAARMFIEQITSGHEQIALKDPRMSLFLPGWSEVAPEARFLFIFRDPAKVAASLVKRGDFRKRRPLPVWQAHHSLQVWSAYNECVADFARKHPESCLLLHAPDDLSGKQQSLIEHVIREKWGFDLPELDLAKALNPKLVRHYAQRPFAGLLSWLPRIEPQYEELIELRTQINRLHEST